MRQREQSDRRAEDDSGLRGTILELLYAWERVCLGTYHKARTSADHEHRAGAVQAALLVKASVMHPADEQVGDAEAHAADDEIEDDPREGFAMRLHDAFDSVLGQWLVRAEVHLPPLRFGVVGQTRGVTGSTWITYRREAELGRRHESGPPRRSRSRCRRSATGS